MEKDRLKWNERYLQHPDPCLPSEIVTRFHGLAIPGRALDIAAGAGGNSLFLAERGFHVDAVDISDVAMNRLDGRHPRVSARCEDLDAWMIPERGYELILNIRYLNRRLFPYIQAGLASGGIVIAETYLEGIGDAGVSCRDYLLRTNELLHAFIGLNVVYYEEKMGESRRGPIHVAALVGRKSS